MSLLNLLGQALLASLGMAWQVLWSLVIGFLISGMIQAYVSRAGMSKILGRAGFKEIALATGFGAASSSCSYAAIAASKSMFKRGAHLIPALAFMFSSTNLVIELGLIQWQLMGWQFALAEWLGGIVLVAIVSLLVKLTLRRLSRRAEPMKRQPKLPQWIMAMNWLPDAICGRNYVRARGGYM